MLFERFFIYHSFYVVLSHNHMSVRLLESEVTFTPDLEAPFSSQNLLISHMDVAQKMLKQATKTLSLGFSFTKPLIIIHPTKLLKEELTAAEKRLYTIFASAIKPRKILFTTGAELEFSALKALVEEADRIEL